MHCRASSVAGARRAGEVQRILVVEDDPVLRQSIQWALEDEGLQVDTAADGRQALGQLARRRPALVLLDMRLPIVGGEAVADGLHAAYGDEVPIVVITADGRAAEKARRVGAVDFLAKPFEIDDLIGVVHRALGAGS